MRPGSDWLIKSALAQEQEQEQEQWKPLPEQKCLAPRPSLVRILPGLIAEHSTKQSAASNWPRDAATAAGLDDCRSLAERVNSMEASPRWSSMLVFKGMLGSKAL
jgi:hypothetical protein